MSASFNFVCRTTLHSRSGHARQLKRIRPLRRRNIIPNCEEVVERDLAELDGERVWVARLRGPCDGDLPAGGQVGGNGTDGERRRESRCEHGKEETKHTQQHAFALANATTRFIDGVLT